jgi:predicted O-linked N-acetylglucosamine transferase (SPINDLY family)
LGIIAAQTRRAEVAAYLLGRAVAADPANAMACNNYGKALEELGRYDEALLSYERALKLRPDYAVAYNNRGNTLHELKRHTEALESYERALKFAPDYADASSNRGVALHELGRYAEALQSYERALALSPGYADAYNNRGNTLQELERVADARDSYERALKIEPDMDWLYGEWLHAGMRVCDWKDLDFHIANLIAKVRQDKQAAPPFIVLTLTDSLAVQRQAAQTWVRARCRGAPARFPFQKRRGERIRIGYYSADYHNHATAYLIAELFETHDRGSFEIVALSYGPDKADDMRKRLSAAVGQFIDVRAKTDNEIAALSRNLAIDIAVDLKGFTKGARTGIFACRAAPIQASYLGFPGTMGTPYIDYVIADQTLIPPASREFYAEKIVYLPNSYQVNDRKRRIAGKQYTRAELGLPSTGFVFCCFNNNYKITPKVFDVWMRLLRKVAGSVLWLLEDNTTAAGNLRREAHARDVDAGRLVFARREPLPEHLARHRAADLFIDTFPCNAHTTASDALWAGLPVLTCTGESFAARVAASLLHAIGLPELIANTQAQYEAMALELAVNPGRLAEFKDRLARNRLTTPLFDTERFASGLEGAYTQMHERYQAGLSPEHIHVVQ